MLASRCAAAAGGRAARARRRTACRRRRTAAAPPRGPGGGQVGSVPFSYRAIIIQLSRNHYSACRRRAPPRAPGGQVSASQLSSNQYSVVVQSLFSGASSSRPSRVACTCATTSIGPNRPDDITHFITHLGQGQGRAIGESLNHLIKRRVTQLLNHSRTSARASRA